MEASPSKFFEPLALAVLPVEIISQIGSYLADNEVIDLLRVGNRNLERKMRQIRAISLCWKSSAFYNWNDCSAFIKGFNKLEELSLSTKLTFHLPSELQKTSLPPSFLARLGSLSLHFHGALDMLHFVQLAAFMPSMTYLSLEDHSLSSTPRVITLNHLPNVLQHLFIRVKDVPRFTLIQATGAVLPPELASFDVNMEFRGFSPSPYGAFAGISRLRHLGIFTATPIEISHFAQELRVLKVYSGIVKIRGENVNDSGFREGPPIRSLLPLLHTLEVQDTLFIHDLETMPLSLTSLSARIDWLGHSRQAKKQQLCASLNARYLASKNPDRPGAPAMLRRFEIPEDKNDFLHVFLPYFTGLTTFFAPASPRTIHPHQLMPNVQTVVGNRLQGNLDEWPRSITSIECATLALPTEALRLAVSSSKLPVLFPSLVSLSISVTRTSKVLIYALPGTLETLNIIIATQEDLNALGRQANERKLLPRLTSLAIKTTLALPSDRISPIVFSLQNVPLTLKELRLKGRFEMKPAYTAYSLCYHPNLTTLKVAAIFLPREILPLLPKQLLRASIDLAMPINLDDPDEVALLLNLPPHLRHLRIDVDSAPMSDLNVWFHPTRPKPLRSSRWNILSMGWNEIEFQLLRACPPTMVSEFQLYVISENFALSCLPKNLSSFHAPFRANHDIEIRYHFTHHTTFLQKLIGDGVLKMLLRALYRTALRGRFPLLGLFEPRQYKQVLERNKRLQELPPNISSLKTHRAGLRLPEPRMDSFPRDAASFVGRGVFHLLNVIVWLHLRYVLQLNRSTHPFAWAFQWINLLGSAIAIPIQWYHFRNAERLFLTDGQLLRGLAVACIALPAATGFLWLTNASAAVAFNYWPTQSGIWFRLLAFMVAGAGEVSLFNVLSTLLGSYD